MSFKSDKQRKAVMAILRKRYGAKKHELVLFHTTPTQNVASILRHGLRATGKSQSYPRRSVRNYAFLAPTEKGWKRWVAAKGKPVVLAAVVPRRAVIRGTRHLYHAYFKTPVAHQRGLKFLRERGNTRRDQQERFNRVEYAVREKIPPNKLFVVKKGK